ncbi:MAG: DsbA family protein [bacterium]|nr:DsbA family protein [bacterium]
MRDQPTTRQRTLFRLLLLAASFAAGAVGWFLLGEPETVIAEETPHQKVVARVNGIAISESKIMERAAGGLAKLERQRHELLVATINTEVIDHLLLLEAEKRGITREELMKIEVEDKVSEVAAADVDAFYAARQARIRQPKQRVEGQIRKLLGYEAFVGRLKAVYEIEYLLEPFRVEVAATGPAKGPKEAPVTIVEFSDFECPFCGRIAPTMSELLENYGDKVRVVFRQFPLPAHSKARKAGEASLCADEQGKFWEMHDLMFGDQQNLDGEVLKQKAATIADLDGEAFNECLDSEKHAQTVADDVTAATRLGLSGTPAFFINGRFVSGAVGIETFTEVIDEELAQLKKAG